MDSRAEEPLAGFVLILLGVSREGDLVYKRTGVP